MISQRTRPLYGVLALGALVCIARLFQIQVGEHEVWAVEAARQVSFGSVIPYRRGRILDARGNVLAKDKETHHLVLVYRRFRRSHPLGEVAHARSLLEGRAVGLAEARARLLEWTRELVGLSPADVEAFREGRGFARGSLVVAPIDEPDDEARGARAADLRFYLRRLLDLSPRTWVNLWKSLDPAHEERSFLELAAAWEGRDVAATWDAIAERIRASDGHLERLAWLLERGASDAPGDADEALGHLLARLETSRRWVEDATASKLFAEATGFAPGRVAPHALRAFFDLRWIQRILCWDDERLAEWTETARESWLASWRDGYALAYLVADLRLDPAFEPGPDDLLDRVASIFAVEGAVEEALDDDPRPWNRVDDLAVFGQLDDVFEASAPGGGRPVLPFQSPELRAFRPAPSRRWGLIDAMLERGPEEQSMGERARRHLAGHAHGDADASYALAKAIADDWERVFQSALLERLLAVRRAADPDECSPEGRLLFDQGARRRAAERAEFYLKDYGMRPRPLLDGEPGYDVVYLLTRYEESYPGFEAREACERIYPVARDDEGRLAGPLIGHVSSVSVYDLERQRSEAQRLASLRNRPRRTGEEERELVRLVGSVLLPDEVKGVAGVEGQWNPELVGQNGYRESHGLEERLGRDTPVLMREARDGQDVALTLDAGLQRAAQRTLQHPEPMPSDPWFDTRWNHAPVGAIVLLTPDGDVLAAASEPEETSELPEDLDGQRSIVMDRTLRVPTFQPPGSVFKPFVAAYALDRIGLDPERTVLCGPIERGGCGYVDVRCHDSSGHGEVNLEQALVGSCNAYFAWLGETLSADDLHALARMFGFGEPTGIRGVPLGAGASVDRVGLREDVPELFQDSLSDFNRRLAGNGLAVVEATPMQLARATAGLATGWLPSVRLVQRVGERALEHAAPRRIDIAGESLARVRAALGGVAASVHGTAHKALRADQVGFPIAVKTGSADLVGRNDSEGQRRVRKHTWVAGWMPPEDPKAVFVVFMHDTMSTSSHGAVYLARQFLRQPEVVAWLRAAGVEVAGAADEAR